MRAHPHLLFEDLRILVIDLDPQSSATMFLNHKSAVGIVNTTSARAMLQNVTREELLEEFIVPSIVHGVDVMPASIDDAFIASDWKELCGTHLPGQNVHAVLRENVIDKLRGDYDFILVDSGPHLDAFLKTRWHRRISYLPPLPRLQSISIPH